MDSRQKRGDTPGPRREVWSPAWLDRDGIVVGVSTKFALDADANRVDQCSRYRTVASRSELPGHVADERQRNMESACVSATAPYSENG
jgi:hypothetical protein